MEYIKLIPKECNRETKLCKLESRIKIYNILFSDDGYFDNNIFSLESEKKIISKSNNIFLLNFFASISNSIDCHYSVQVNIENKIIHATPDKYMSAGFIDMINFNMPIELTIDNPLTFNLLVSRCAKTPLIKITSGYLFLTKMSNINAINDVKTVSKNIINWNSGKEYTSIFDNTYLCHGYFCELNEGSVKMVFDGTITNINLEFKTNCKKNGHISFNIIKVTNKDNIEYFLKIYSIKLGLNEDKITYSSDTDLFFSRGESIACYVKSNEDLKIRNLNVSMGIIYN